MCRSSSCCCNATSGAPLGVAAAVVVSAEAAFITGLIAVIASAALAGGLLVAGYVAWRVRVLTRPAPAARLLAVRQATALPAAAPRAIDPPRPLPARQVSGLPVKEDLS